MADNKLSKEDLIILVRRICKADFTTEEALEEGLQAFLDNVPDPEALRLIYHHKPDLTPEEIVEKALAYKPILL